MREKAFVVETVVPFEVEATIVPDGVVVSCNGEQVIVEFKDLAEAVVQKASRRQLKAAPFQLWRV